MRRIAVTVAAIGLACGSESPVEAENDCTRAVEISESYLDSETGAVVTVVDTMYQIVC